MLYTFAVSCIYFCVNLHSLLLHHHHHHHHNLFNTLRVYTLKNLKLKSTRNPKYS